MHNCAICGIEIFSENPKRFFCRDCYKEWESDIMAKTDWVKVCINDEHQRRRQALKDRELTYLGNGFDVGDFDGEYSLVPTKEYYEERKVQLQIVGQVDVFQ